MAKIVFDQETRAFSVVEGQGNFSDDEKKKAKKKKLKTAVKIGAGVTAAAALAYGASKLGKGAKVDGRHQSVKSTEALAKHISEKAAKDASLVGNRATWIKTYIKKHPGITAKDARDAWQKHYEQVANKDRTGVAAKIVNKARSIKAAKGTGADNMFNPITSAQKQTMKEEVMKSYKAKKALGQSPDLSKMMADWKAKHKVYSEPEVDLDLMNQMFSELV